jgi:hypothetical protein
VGIGVPHVKLRVGIQDRLLLEQGTVIVVFIYAPIVEVPCVCVLLGPFKAFALGVD